MDPQTLRSWQHDKNVNAGVRQIIGMAADEIERLRTALRPFSIIGASDMLKDAKSVTVSDPEIFRHAAKVINGQ